MAGNWKMYKTPAETTAFFEKFLPMVAQSSHCEIVICPPYTDLFAAAAVAKGSAVHIGAQNVGMGERGCVHGRDFGRDDR